MADSFTTFPPSGLDRADGTGDFPGTPTPDNAISRQIATELNDAGTYFEESPDSPQFNFGEQGTIKHDFECDPDTFFQLIPLIQRGQITTDSYGDVSKVLESSATYSKGNRYKVSVTSEGLNWGIPPDEFDVQPQDINPDLMKHPRYNYGPAGANTATGYGLTAQMKQAIRFIINQNTNYMGASGFNMIFNGAGIVGPGGVIKMSTTQQQMAWEIIQKYYRGEDTFYLPALVVTYSSYYYSPQPLCPGGFLDDPIFSSSGASVPYFFWSIDGTDDPSNTNNILQNIEEQDQWNLWSNGVTYLRKADTFQYARTWFKLTQTWVGAPTGPEDQNNQTYIFWDPDLYKNPPTELGPLPTTD